MKHHRAVPPLDSLVDALERALRRAVDAQPDLDLRVLPEGQFLVRHGMVPNPAAREGLKTTSHVPGEDGFEMFVRCHSPGGHVGVPTPVVAEPHSDQIEALQVMRVGETRSWRVAVAEGMEVAVRVTSGPRASGADINKLLDAIDEAVRGRSTRKRRR